MMTIECYGDLSETFARGYGQDTDTFVTKFYVQFMIVFWF